MNYRQMAFASNLLKKCPNISINRANRDSGTDFATCHHWHIGDTEAHFSMALQGPEGRVYKQLTQAISLPYPGVMRGKFDASNGAVSDEYWILILDLSFSSPTCPR